DSVFTLGLTSTGNLGGEPYIAYLWATLPGISKVGIYTGTAAPQVINCGFTTGARFILFGDVAGGDWFVVDAVRGITAFPTIAAYLNYGSAESGLDSAVRPNATGFALDDYGPLNSSGKTYLYLAIA